MVKTETGCSVLMPPIFSLLLVFPNSVPTAPGSPQFSSPLPSPWGRLCLQQSLSTSPLLDSCPHRPALLSPSPSSTFPLFSLLSSSAGGRGTGAAEAALWPPSWNGQARGGPRNDEKSDLFLHRGRPLPGSLCTAPSPRQSQVSCWPCSQLTASPGLTPEPGAEEVSICISGRRGDGGRGCRSLQWIAPSTE